MVQSAPHRFLGGIVFLAVLPCAALVLSACGGGRRASDASAGDMAAEQQVRTDDSAPADAPFVPDGVTPDDSPPPDLQSHDRVEPPDAPEPLELSPPSDLADVPLPPDVEDVPPTPDTSDLDLSPDLGDAPLTPEISDVPPPPDSSDASESSDLGDVPTDSDSLPPNPAFKCKVSADCLKHDDDDLCNGVPKCVDGACFPDPKSAVVCPPAESDCNINLCQPDTGECGTMAAPDGKGCDDGNPLTLLDLCADGKCLGTGAASCSFDADCDDLYPCTVDKCVAGKCQRNPITCAESKPQDCKMAVCNAAGQCIEKPYDQEDAVVYHEDFLDHLAQGWTYPTPAALAKVEASMSGKQGLALTLVPGGSVVVAPPLLQAPPMSLVVSIAIESWNPAACAEQRFTLKANGKVVTDQSLCPFGEQEGGLLAFGLPKGVQGVLTLSLGFQNLGPNTVKIVIGSLQMEGQGGSACCQDFDQDKLWACIDNCPDWHNPDQSDCDFDGVGDLCDQDSDNDGVDNKFDAYPCNPAAQLDVRIVATRTLAPLEPVAAACSPAHQVCYFLELSGDHVLADLRGIPSALVSLPEIQLARSATFCSDLLWVLDSGTIVWAYDISNPNRPRLVQQYPLPTGLVSLEQTLACHEGDLILSSGHWFYELEAGGTYSEFFDVLEEIWAAAMTPSVYLAVTRSPQPPFLFFLRVLPVGGKQSIIPLKATPEEPSPACQFEEMTLSGWGSAHPAGALWTVVRGCLHPSLQLRDPWAAWLPSSDLDGDGLADLSDPDDDGDSVPDPVDFAPLDSFTASDLDGDGKGNLEDPDDDGDGMSDNYAGLPGAVITEECFFPGLALSGIETVEQGYRLAGAGGTLLDADFACNGGVPANPQFAGLDSMACGDGGECVFHSSANKALYRLVGDSPESSFDSPELPSGATPLNTDLAWSDDQLYLGNDASNRIFALDFSGNVRSEIRLPAQFAGIARTSDDRLVVLLALSQDSSAILRVDPAGNLLGFLPIPAGGLRSLARLDDDTFLTLSAGAEGTSIVRIELPMGLQAFEPTPQTWAEAKLNPQVIVAPDVPESTSNGSVLVTWPLQPIPDLAGLQLCWICGTVAGYIPPQNCKAAFLTAGQGEVTGLPAQKCAFELRATTLSAGVVSSRRVSILVDQPGTGSIVWSKTGTQSSLAWTLVAVPRLLSL